MALTQFELISLEILKESAKFISQEGISTYDKKHLYAVKYNLSIISEIAISALSQSTQTAYFQLPWNQFKRLRNPLLHWFHWNEETSDRILFEQASLQIRSITESIEAIVDIELNQSLREVPLVSNLLFNEFIVPLEQKDKSFQKQRREKKRLRDSDERDIKYLNIILAEIENIKEFKNNKEKLDSLELNAIKMSLMIIGLSIKDHISNEFKKNKPLEVSKIGYMISWNSISKIKDYLIHQYYEIDNDIIEQTIIEIIAAYSAIIEIRNDLISVKKKKTDTAYCSNPDEQESKGGPQPMSFFISNSEDAKIESTNSFLKAKK